MLVLWYTREVEMVGKNGEDIHWGDEAVVRNNVAGLC